LPLQALPLARVLLAPLACDAALDRAALDARTAPPGTPEAASAAVARLGSSKRLATVARRRADDAARLTCALAAPNLAVAEQWLLDPVARVAVALPASFARAAAAKGAAADAPAPAMLNVGVLGALATAAAPAALAPTLAANAQRNPAVAELPGAMAAAAFAASGRARSWAGAALRLRAAAALLGPLSATPARQGLALADFCAQALQSGLVAVCLAVVDHADDALPGSHDSDGHERGGSSSSSSGSQRSGDAAGAAGGGSSSDGDDDDDDDESNDDGSDCGRGRRSPAQDRVAAQVHALAILQALEDATAPAPATPASATGPLGPRPGDACAAVAALLAASGGWGRARGQRHDLMMVNAVVAGYLTN
jgi:uncharacterized membrane protein YgcG